MQIIAKVLNIEIFKHDLEREMCCGGDSQRALHRLIDRCLLLVKALQLGYEVSDEEFDVALFELLDEQEPFGLPSGSLLKMSAREMETLLRRNIIIKKYLKSIYPKTDISEQTLHTLYQEQEESFMCEEMVRCSHIFITGEDAKERIHEIRSRIHNKEDFLRFCSTCSQCPSHKCCGDLGYFPRGKLFGEIDAVAFSLKQDEISEPFASPEGYHILMLTDRKAPQRMPFEQIKSSLMAQLKQMEREYYLLQHLGELYKEYKNNIIILNDAYKQA
ncbi:MAG: peptidylprolyl isomerase [Candidatus Cloacimonetes bacterium]|nr:peptidylprolyl isomerase [Candidatus Cloacimonadota bacterium]